MYTVGAKAMKLMIMLNKAARTMAGRMVSSAIDNSDGGVWGFIN
jgi:hypothetical protein